MVTGSEPRRVERVGEGALKVEWTDGHESLYPWELLRRSCPCAVCREGMGNPGGAGPVRAMEVKPVGRYAVTIRWSDGHSTGIFSYDLLRSLCPCEACQPDQLTEG